MKYHFYKLLLIAVFISVTGCTHTQPSATNINNTQLIPYANLKGINLSGHNLEGLNLKGANLASADLSNANLKGTNLTQINWTGTNFKGAAYDQNTIFPADDFDPQKEGMRLEVEIGPGIDFRGVTFKGMNITLKGKDLSRSNFQGMELTGYDLSSSNMDSTIFSGAYLGNTNFTNAKATEADFTGALLNNAHFSNATCTNCKFQNANLNGVQFDKANLQGSDFTKATITGAIFKDVNLSQVNLSSANLEGTDLQGVNLEGVNLYQTSLKNAKLQGADLTDAQIFSADLAGAFYDENTQFPDGFIPQENKMSLVSSKKKLSTSENESTTPLNKTPESAKTLPKKSIRSQSTDTANGQAPALDSSYQPRNDYRQSAPINHQPNWAAYMQAVNTRLIGSWNPPDVPVDASVVVTMVIGKDGNLLSASTKSSSGNSLLDQAAMRAVNAAAPFPPLPTEFQGDSQTIDYRFDYAGSTRRAGKKR